MRNSYVIQWKSTVNGRAGRGTKVFDRVEAERLADELNGEYPEILHQAVIAQPKAKSEIASVSLDSEALVIAQ
jgi:hypothetical protein